MRKSFKSSGIASSLSLVEIISLGIISISEVGKNVFILFFAVLELEILEIV